MMKVRLLSFIIFCFISLNAIAAEFVSLRSSEVNMRAGPSKNYPIKWIYKRKSLPLKVLATIDDWKKVKDIKGASGWVHKSVVSTARYALVVNVDYVVMYKYPSEDSKKLLRLERMVQVRVKQCDKDWCQVKVNKFLGWVPKKNLWGDTSGLSG